MTITDGMGYIAASLVLATFCAKRMVSLRVLAISSNVAFITYGPAAQLWPVVVLRPSPPSAARIIRDPQRGNLPKAALAASSRPSFPSMLPAGPAPERSLD
jgi:hypothetical protein